MKKDIIFNLIDEEFDRQIRGIELIASENFTSPEVLSVMGTVLTNKYAEGLPHKRYYGGCEVVDKIEDLARNRLKELFKANWVNVQPHSGSQANAAVMLGLLNPGDAILGFDLAHGGHLTHGSPVSFSGKLYKTAFYGVEPKTGIIDWNKIEDITKKHKPKLIICGASAYSRDWNYQYLRKIADNYGAILMADIAHTAGFVAVGLLNDALEHCHVVTSTTHKTLRGPRGGIIMMRHDFPNPFGIKTNKGNIRNVSSLLDSAVFPGIQGGPLEHIIAAKAISFQEALQPEYKNYMHQVRKNAQSMARAFGYKNYNIISNGTDNHLLLIDLRSKNLTGKQAENALGKADITVNKNMVPFDSKSPMITSGIRIGTAAITSRGLKENDMFEIVEIIDNILKNISDDRSILRIKKHINTFMRKYPLYKK